MTCITWFNFNTKVGKKKKKKSLRTFFSITVQKKKNKNIMQLLRYVPGTLLP